MVRLIMGVKGSGKTKQLIELINNAAKDEPGNVVCIEANRTMTYDIHYHIRLIDAQEYNLDSYELFRGFISGLYAGNYDISHVFIDNLCKTIGREVDKAGRLWREEQHQVHRHHQRRPLPGYRRDAEVPVRLLRFPIYTDAASANWQRRRFSGFRFAPGRIRRPAPPADCNCHSPPQRTGR